MGVKACGRDTESYAGDHVLVSSAGRLWERFSGVKITRSPYIFCVIRDV